MCGRAKTEVFKYDDVMPRFKAHSFVDTIRNRYVLTQIFLNTGEKNLRFRKYTATCGRGHRYVAQLSVGFVLFNWKFSYSVNGSWSNWSIWSLCSKTCGNGTRTRTRTCTSPSPTNGGLNCTGRNVEHERCTVRQECPGEISTRFYLHLNLLSTPVNLHIWIYYFREKRLVLRRQLFTYFLVYLQICQCKVERQ